jgi:hypothetical protein
MNIVMLFNIRIKNDEKIYYNESELFTLRNLCIKNIKEIEI